MPRGDRTGPYGQDPGTGRGMQSNNGGRGRGGGFAAGTGGECICPSCGGRIPHQAGKPCFKQKCPKCGATMTRG